MSPEFTHAPGQGGCGLTMILIVLFVAAMAWMLIGEALDASVLGGLL